VRLIFRVLNCEQLLEAPLAPWAWHSERVVVGRGEKYGVFGDRLSLDDPRVSGSHAALEWKAGTLFVEDLGSSNGTWVDGQRIKGRVSVEPGGLVEVGRTFLAVRELAARDAAQLVDAAQGFDTLTSFSPVFGAVLREAARAAPTRESCLILGETGTGKDVLARALHKQSRRKGPFVAVDAGAIPDSLFESTLFGHEKGAFTGAESAREGELTRADKGTLFLDEVGNLSPASQARLLRVLETGHVTPLGSKQGLDVDVRVIAATNRGVLEGDGFREDLVHRLSGFVFSLPPLRERREDLGLIIKALLEDAKVKKASMAMEAARALLNGPFTGNVRELRNVLRRAAAGHPEVRIEEIQRVKEPKDSKVTSPAKAAKGAKAAAVERPRGWKPERAELMKVLEECNGSPAAAARALGTYPRQLYRWLEELGLKPDDYRS
jgi:DNA-binding NtrC family response regulator